MQRGPYRNSHEAYTKAIELRQNGWGYSRIAKEIEKPTDTVRKWVKHIPAPIAHSLYAKTLVIPFEKLTSKSQIRKRLLEEREWKCEECRITEWFGRPITLEVEHVDGNVTNNTKSNLKLLCPNCHSYTPTWRRKKKPL